MLAFIKSQPSVVECFLRHIEMPPFVDLLIRIIQLDELPEGAGTLEVRTHFFHANYMLKTTKTVVIVPELHSAADRPLGAPTHIRRAHYRGGTHQKQHC